MYVCMTSEVKGIKSQRGVHPPPPPPLYRLNSAGRKKA